MVWNDRLLLFWLQIMKEAPDDALRSQRATKELVDAERTTDAAPDPRAVTTQAMLCWSEYYNGKWQPPKTSDVDLPSDIHSSSTAFIRRNLTLGVSYDETQEWLRVSILYQGSARTSFVLYNTHSSPVRQADQTGWNVSRVRVLGAPYRGIDPSDTDSTAILDHHLCVRRTRDDRAGAGLTQGQSPRAGARYAGLRTIAPHHPLGEKRGRGAVLHGRPPSRVLRDHVAGREVALGLLRRGHCLQSGLDGGGDRSRR